MELKDYESILKHLNSFSWENKVADEMIFDIAKNNFLKLTQGKTKNHKIIRLAGQSGSGKTTQLLPTANAYCKKHGICPIRFAVRDFAPLHPNYNELLQEFGKEQIREKTNGFALRCLLISLILAIDEGYDILFEVTLLSRPFEDFIFLHLYKNNYSCLFLVLAVNKEISDYFIHERSLHSVIEAKRVVYKASSDYFEKALCDEISYFAQAHKNERVIIWSAYDFLPVFDGKFADAEKVFFETKKITSHKFQNEDELRDAKIKYILNLN